MRPTASCGRNTSPNSTGDLPSRPPSRANRLSSRATERTSTASFQFKPSGPSTATGAVKYKNLTLQIDRQVWRRSMEGCRVTVYQHLGGEITIGYGPLGLGKYTAAGLPLDKKVVEIPRPRKTAKDAVSLSRLEKPRQKTARLSHISTTTTTGINL